MWVLGVAARSFLKRREVGAGAGNAKLPLPMEFPSAAGEAGCGGRIVEEHGVLWELGRGACIMCSHPKAFHDAQPWISSFGLRQSEPQAEVKNVFWEAWTAGFCQP